MLAALAVILSFMLPADAEPYLAADSAYAEIAKVDVTVSFFDNALAAQAKGEFKDGFENPETARAGVVVQKYEATNMGDRSGVLVEYTKPALVAALDENGEVKVVQGQELTRQIYVDYTGGSIVFTIWSKAEGADVDAVANAFLATIDLGGSDWSDSSTLRFEVDGADPQSFMDGLAGDALTAPQRIDVISD